MTDSIARQPAGSSTGGRFAPSTRPEPVVSLAPAPLGPQDRGPKWTAIVDAVADNLRRRNYRTDILEGTARLVPLTNPAIAGPRGLSERQWQRHAATGSALERVLRERYEAAWADLSDAEVMARAEQPSEAFRDRVDRARSDILHSLLEERHPELGDPYDAYTATHIHHTGLPLPSWRQHLREFYRIES